LALLDFLNKRKPNNSNESEMSFIDHLEELRWVILRSVLACLVGAIIVFSYRNAFFDGVIMAPNKADFVTYKFLCNFGKTLGIGDALCMVPTPIKLQSNQLVGQFNMAFSFSFVAGFILAFPFIFWQFWKFIKPALSTKERKGVTGVIFWVSLLFFIGIAFGFFFLAPYSFNFFSSFSLSSSIEIKPTVTDYLDLLLTFTLGCGLAFQLPIVLYFLGKVGIVSASFLKKYFRHAIVIIVIVAAIITPPDGITQIIVATPLILLYWVSIALVARVNKEQKKEDLEWE
jgi:sec-independent protein translocase protein TatC